VGANPYAQYQKTQIETADKGKLLLMLYDGALRFLGHARKALLEKDLEGANNYLVKVQDIVAELMSSLDLEAGEIAVSLFRLYEYMHYLLVQANVKKDAGPLDQVEGMLAELRDTWKEALGLVSAKSPSPQENTQEAVPTAKKQKGEIQAGSLAGYSQGMREEKALKKGYKKVNFSG